MQATLSMPTADDVAAVVGPDEPVGAQTWADSEREHWRSLAARLVEAGVSVDPERLAEMTVRVELAP